jgi:RNA polymerase sigma factor (sigma-70 family)
MNSQDLANKIDKTIKIFEEHEAFIRSIIRYQVKDDNQVDDLFQDFFLSLVSKPILENVKDIKGYLYRAITNDLIDAARRTISYKAAVQRFAENLNFSVNNHSPGNALIEGEEIERMLELIEGFLPRSQAKAISLRYKNGYNTDEIAEEMNINSRSVSRYISVGLKTIRRLWAVNKERQI